MEVSAKRAILVAFLVMLTALALPASPCGATDASLLKKNGSNIHCTGGRDECLIADDYADLEFMMGSGRSKMLAEDPIYTTQQALLASKAALCGRPGERYQSCTTDSNPKRPPTEHCPRYGGPGRNRVCNY